jgi:hypothetical protein
MIKSENRLKILAASLLAAVLVVSIGLIWPQKAEAIPVEDVGTHITLGMILGDTGILVGSNAVIAKATAATAKATAATDFTTIATLGEIISNWASQLARWAKEDAMKGLRDVVAKRIINYIVDQTIVWIQGGGQPKFVSNWEGFLKDAGNIAFDYVIQQVRLARLCSPFGLQVRLSLLPVQRFPTQISCTLDQVVANINNFYADFSRGGWLAYNTMWEPQNNYYGQMLMIQDQIQTETSRKVTAAANEAIASAGFLGVKRCLEPIYSTTESQYCDGGEDEFGNCPGGYLTKMSLIRTGCKKEEIITPGTAVGEAVKNAITSDKDWAANIQSWTAALVDAVINRVIKEGIGGMKSLLAGGGEGGGNEASSYMPSGYQNLTANEFQGQKQQLSSSLQSFINEKQSALSNKSKSFSLAQQTLSALETVRSRNCGVSNEEIQNVQNQISRLNTDIAILNNSISELNATANRVNQVTNTETLMIANQETTQIMNKYRNDSSQQSVQNVFQELQERQAAFDNAQSRLSVCAVNTTGTSTSTAPAEGSSM